MRKQLSQNDFYTQKAKAEHYPARSVYKLQEIESHFHLLKEGDRVLDLGAAPGSWLMHLAKKVGPSGLVIGLDLVDLRTELPQNSRFFKRDILANDWQSWPETQDQYQAVVSDLAPQTTGIRFKDVAASLELCSRAWQIAQKVLAKGGCFVCKIFEGQGADEFVGSLKPYFKTVKVAKPQAIRKRSKEFYLVAQSLLRD